MRRTSLTIVAALTAFGVEAGNHLADGQVTKIDTSAQKITIKHGPLKNLDMPEMTMVFRAQDPKMLTTVKVGDKVRFGADRVNGQLTVTEINKSK